MIILGNVPSKSRGDHILGTSLVIGHRDDLIAKCVTEMLIARKRPVARLARWSDVCIAFGDSGDNAFWSLVTRSDRKEIPLREITLVLCRGIPAVNSGLPRRSQRYAQEEWQAALSVLTTLSHCPILNSPLPDNPRGHGHHFTNGGWRLCMERALGSRCASPGCVSNLVPPALDAYTLGVIANGPATDRDVEQAKLGFELLSTRRLRGYTVPLYWIVGKSVVLQKSLELDSGAVGGAKFDEECIRFAEKCAQAANLDLGTLWLFPCSDGEWHFGGLDRFPPSHYLDGGEMVLAAAICDQYTGAVEARSAASPLGLGQ